MKGGGWTIWGRRCCHTRKACCHIQKVLLPYTEGAITIYGRRYHHIRKALSPYTEGAVTICGGADSHHVQQSLRQHIQGAHDLYKGLMIYTRGSWSTQGAHDLHKGLMIYTKGSWSIQGAHDLLMTHITCNRVWASTVTPAAPGESALVSSGGSQRYLILCGTQR